MIDTMFISRRLVAVTVIAVLFSIDGLPQESGKEAQAKNPKPAPSTNADDPSAGVLPPDPLAVPPMPRTVPGLTGLFGEAYWYLPYAITNEEQGLAFVEAYERVLKSGKDLPDELQVPEGKGAGGSDTLPRLQEGVSDSFIANINNPAASAVSQSDIPVIISQPRPGDTQANVLYMDGHVELVQRGDFPLTDAFLAALKELDPPEYSDEDRTEKS